VRYAIDVDQRAPGVSKLTFVDETRIQPGTGRGDMRTSTWRTLELVNGGKPSKALLRRIAELQGLPGMLADYPEAVGQALRVRTVRRAKREERAYY
jgi:hypothetical protein